MVLNIGPNTFKNNDIAFTTDEATNGLIIEHVRSGSELTLDNDGNIVLKNQNLTGASNVESDSVSVNSIHDKRENHAIPQHRGSSRWSDPPNSVPRDTEDSPTIAWILDDGLESQYEYRNVFNDEDVKPELGVITGSVGDTGYFSWDELDTLVNEQGWGLMNHSHAHEGYDSKTREEIEEDVFTSEEIFAENGYRPSSFLYPQSQTAGNLGISIVSDFYGHAFHDKDAPIGHTSSLNISFVGKHPHLLNRVQADERPIEEIKERIDVAIENNKPMFLGSHDIVDKPMDEEGNLETSIEKIEEIIAYARDEGMTWGSYEDAIPEFPQWGINVDPDGDEHYIRPNSDNGNWFYHAKGDHNFLGGIVRLPNLPDDSGTSQGIWWDDGSGSRDEGLYTQVAGTVVQLVNNENTSEGSDKHHNDSVGLPSYPTLEDVPDIPEGHMVYVESEGSIYVESGESE